MRSIPMSPAVLLGFVLCLFIAVKALLARRSRGEEQVRPTADGVSFPILGAYLRTGFLLNSMRSARRNSALLISHDSIHFHVLGQYSWLLDDIEGVDVRKALLGPRIVFQKGRKSCGVLAVEVSDMEVARQLLAALPASTPLTSEAATLLQGRPSAGTPGARRYYGRTA